MARNKYKVAMHNIQRVSREHDEKSSKIGRRRASTASTSWKNAMVDINQRKLQCVRRQRVVFNIKKKLFRSFLQNSKNGEGLFINYTMELGGEG